MGHRSNPGRRQVVALDSGIGGFGIASAIRRAVPEAAVAFVADHAFFPYGEKPAAALVARLEGLVGSLRARLRPEVVVIACNTASTIALAPLRARFPDTEFVGCVPPVKWAAALSRTRVIGLLATEATVGRDYVRDLRERFAPDCRLLAHGARHLAGLAEARFVGVRPPPGAVGAELERLFAQPGGELIDTVCLGCTHYALLLPELRDAAPRAVDWLDPADAVARRTASVLDHRAASGHATADPAEFLDGAFTTRWPDAREAFVRACRAQGFDTIGVWDA